MRWPFTRRRASSEPRRAGPPPARAAWTRLPALRPTIDPAGLPVASPRPPTVPPLLPIGSTVTAREDLPVPAGTLFGLPSRRLDGETWETGEHTGAPTRPVSTPADGAEVPRLRPQTVRRRTEPPVLTRAEDRWIGEPYLPAHRAAVDRASADDGVLPEPRGQYELPPAMLEALSRRQALIRGKAADGAEGAGDLPPAGPVPARGWGGPADEPEPSWLDQLVELDRMDQARRERRARPETLRRPNLAESRRQGLRVPGEPARTGDGTGPAGGDRDVADRDVAPVPSSADHDGRTPGAATAAGDGPSAVGNMPASEADAMPEADDPAVRSPRSRRGEQPPAPAAPDMPGADDRALSPRPARAEELPAPPVPHAGPSQPGTPEPGPDDAVRPGPVLARQDGLDPPVEGAHGPRPPRTAGPIAASRRTGGHARRLHSPSRPTAGSDRAPDSSPQPIGQPPSPTATSAGAPRHEPAPLSPPYPARPEAEATSWVTPDPAVHRDDAAAGLSGPSLSPGAGQVPVDRQPVPQPPALRQPVVPEVPADGHAAEPADAGPPGLPQPADPPSDIAETLDETAGGTAGAGPAQPAPAADGPGPGTNLAPAGNSRAAMPAPPGPTLVPSAEGVRAEMPATGGVPGPAATPVVRHRGTPARWPLPPPIGQEDVSRPAAPAALQPVPAALAERFRTVHGVDVSGVLVRRDEEVARRARGTGARAYTGGGHIGVPDGLGALDAPTNRGLVAHELTHLVQQYALGPALPPESSAHGRALEAVAVANEWAFGAGNPAVPALPAVPAMTALPVLPVASPARTAGPLVAGPPSDRAVPADAFQRAPAGTVADLDEVHDLVQQAVAALPEDTTGLSAAPTSWSPPSVPAWAQAVLDAAPATERAQLDLAALAESLAELHGQVAAATAAGLATRADVSRLRGELDGLAGVTDEDAGGPTVDIDDPASVDGLADRLYPALSRRLRRELLLDRERRGWLATL